MNNNKFNMQICTLIEMTLQGEDVRSYCKEHRLDWFYRQLEIIARAYKTGAFLKEEIKLIYLRSEHLADTFAELDQLSDRICKSNTPVSAVLSRRRLH